MIQDNWWKTTEDTSNDLELTRKTCLSCRKCAIGGQQIESTNISNVFSNMNTKSKIMIVGQNPGLDEVRQKEPFVGMSGKIFVNMLNKYGLDKNMFYFTNIVKCHTSENRQPQRSEIENCQYIIQKEIDIIKPYLIVALGSTALFHLTGLTGISKCSGEIIMSEVYQIPVLPLLHPSPLNTNRNNSADKLEDGIKHLKEIMGKMPEKIEKYINSTNSNVSCKWCSKLGKLEYCCEECKESHNEYIRDTDIFERKYSWQTK